MTGEKRTETRMRCYNTLCIPYISLHPSLHACIVYDCKEGRGVIYREYTECYSISFLFLFFFHQSSLYPIKIFAKCFYLLYKYYFIALCMLFFLMQLFKSCMSKRDSTGLLPATWMEKYSSMTAAPLAVCLLVCRSNCCSCTN